MDQNHEFHLSKMYDTEELCIIYGCRKNPVPRYNMAYQTLGMPMNLVIWGLMELISKVVVKILFISLIPYIELWLKKTHTSIMFAHFMCGYVLPPFHSTTNFYNERTISRTKRYSNFNPK